MNCAGCGKYNAKCIQLLFEWEEENAIVAEHCHRRQKEKFSMPQFMFYCVKDF